MEWNDVAAEFEWDGSLRDIYVLDTSADHWNRLLLALPHWPYASRYTLHGATAPVPQRAEDAFSVGRRALLDLDVESVHVICHFFGLEEIEFDIDPRDVKGTRELRALEGFMRRVGAAVDRPVRMTPENMRERPFFVYAPSDDSFTYTPVGPLT